MNASTSASDISIFGVAPENWCVDRIRDRLEEIVGGEWGDDPDAHDEGVEIPVIRVADIRGLDVTTDNLTIRRVKETKLPNRLIGSQTVLIEKSGGGELQPVGRAVLGQNIKFDAICSNFMTKTDCGRTVIPSFMAYLLDAAYSCGINKAHIQQTTGIQNLRVTDYLNTKVAIPPLPEQQLIAAYLDASCKAIDAAVIAKMQQLKALDSIQKTILLTATTGLQDNVEATPTRSSVIPKIPFGWKLGRLKSVASIRYGLGQPPEELDSGVPMIRATDVDAGTICTDNFLHVNPDDLPPGRDPYLKEGEIIVVRSGAYTGDSAIIPKSLEGAVAGYDMVVTVTQASPRFVAYCLLSRHVLEDQLLLLTLRAAQPHLNAQELGSITLALPPTVEEQEKVADFLDERLNEVKCIASGIKAQIEILNNYRKSLIHECVIGQRRITEADLVRVQAHG